MPGGKTIALAVQWKNGHPWRADMNVLQYMHLLVGWNGDNNNKCNDNTQMPTPGLVIPAIGGYFSFSRMKRKEKR